jgi:hypothetical protein
MRKHEPRPLIEEHYHIESLIAGQEKRVEDREYHRNRIKAVEERNEAIGNALMVIQTDFHCKRCRKDFKQGSVLNVEQDWSNTAQNIAFYKGKHRECGYWAIRYVTDSVLDPFYRASRRVAQERGKHFADLIQPHETGFNLLYGKKI